MHCADEVFFILYRFSYSPGARISCCASEAYDMNEKICCAGVLNEYIGGGVGGGEKYTKCCNTHAYDSHVNVCCNGVSVLMLENVP